jgi:pyrroline-5-carboxylate reductase
MATLAVAGFGKLGSALVRGAVARGVVRASEVCVWARSEPRRKLAAEMGLALVEWPRILHAAPTVLLALKPQAFESMTAGIQRVDPATHWISVMSGWTSAELTARLGGGPAIRAMPSVAASVGASTTGLCVPMGVSPQAADLARRFFGSIGPVVEIDESLMNAVTAVGASGVGFACAFIEALEQAAIQAGLSPATASAVAIGAVEGAVAGVRGGMGTPAELRAQVTSPGGTTAAGLAALQAGQMQALITRAVLVARDRAQELGGGTGR